MKETLTEFWNGNLNPSEWRTENSTEQGKLLDLLDANIQKLSKGLNEEEKRYWKISKIVILNRSIFHARMRL